MRRLQHFVVCAAALLGMWFAVGAHVLLHAQKIDSVREVKDEPVYSSDQRSVIATLTNQTPSTFVTDGVGKFQRTDFAYSEVRFIGNCKFHYAEHRFTVNPSVGEADRVHHYTPITVNVADLMAAPPTVTKFSQMFPAPAGSRYSADAAVVEFHGTSDKGSPHLVFDGEQTARRFVTTLGKAAQSCSAGK